MMILEEENLRKSLKSSIDESRKELDTLCRELKLSSFKVTSLGPHYNHSCLR